MEVGGGGGNGVAASAEAGGSGGDSDEEQKKMPAVGEQKVKRKMKTVAQLEVLERTYAVEPYPSEALRAELSIKLALSDRQLQMWFCHRRLKDRKAKTRKDGPTAALAGVGDQLLLGSASGGEMGNDLSINPFGQFDMPQPRSFLHQPGAAVPRIGAGGELAAAKRYYEPHQAISELRAIAFVEAQLGEPIREDGPILGMAFDPLPPGAFGTPIGASGQQKPAAQACEIYERLEASPGKVVRRAIREYQFLPEQPSLKNDTYEIATPSHYVGSPSDNPCSKAPLFSGQSLMHGHCQVSPGYNLPIQMPCLSFLPQQGKQGQDLSPAAGDIEIAPRRTSVVHIGVDASYGSHPTTDLGAPFMATEKRVFYNEERLERKRKSEEARIAREVEAHEKRIRKELEKQDLLRQKREEQMRREIQRQERERRKEEERLLREKQREEERYQREQKREIERRERYLQKESIRAEKMRLREQLRKEREAARLKALNDRATARRMAKESIELIEDEQLELMELAASDKGLPSILALDAESMENLEYYRDMLPDFPLKSIQLKKPFSIQPWVDSEENVGNLLMVWRFLINFSDVLGLWSFTLDEFLQALHDHDNRLVGEVHIALLKAIMKDIEDVARTPSTALGANQSSVFNPAGGHPHVVAGAYAWGFDIRSWQSHINPLTWPEILRQFALSAGFGPKLKNKSIGQSYLHEEFEGGDGADIISNLRNGVAAENALAIMRERGYSNLRRSRHRLTPGTVKYAAFYILSLEGTKGLTIQEVAEKIQKSGLRDLTTSRTPEASISAALSRDTKLFERTAPSTYCVRAPYRKDPADAESILAAAREKIQVYNNANFVGEEAEDVEKENDERDDDSESDGAEVEDFDAQSSVEVSRFRENNSLGDEKINCHVRLMETPDLKMTGSCSSLGETEEQREMKGTGTSLDGCTDVFDALRQILVDDNDAGETWVQGLTEGEYSDLSVQERLEALIALVSVANEGNSIRVTLEERLEAANSLRKQMWAEAQQDKRRVKEDYSLRVPFSSHMSYRGNQSFTGTNTESRQILLLAADDKSESASIDIQLGDKNNQQIDPNISHERTLQELATGPENVFLQQSGYAFEKSRSQLKSYIGHKAEQTYVYRSLPLGQDRRRNRYWQFIASHSWSDPGSGRIFIELHDGRWRVIDSIEDFDALLASLDVRGFRESHLHLVLQNIEVFFKEAVKRHQSSNSGVKFGYINNRGISLMEPHLDISPTTEFLKSEVSVSSTGVEPFSSCIIELGRNRREKLKALRRYRDFEKWMWEECSNPSILCAMKYGKKRCKSLLSICEFCHNSYYTESNHYPSSHSNYNAFAENLKYSEHVALCKEKLEKEPDWTVHILESSRPLRIRLLKALIASLEASIPPEALCPVWEEGLRNSWGMNLQGALSAGDLLQALTYLEGVITKGFLSSDYETTDELLGPCDLTGLSFDNSGLREVVVLPWIPETASAVALRLMELDSSICYTQQQKEDLQKNAVSANYDALASKYTGVETVPQDMLIEPFHKALNFGQNSWIDVGTAHLSTSRGLSRGRGRPRTREGKSQRRVINSRQDIGQRSIATKCASLGPLPVWKGRPRGRGGRKRGRRSAKNRQKMVKQVTQGTIKKESRKIIIKRTLGPKQDGNNEKISMQTEYGISSPENSPPDYNKAFTAVDEYSNLMIVEHSGVVKGTPAEMVDHARFGVRRDDDDDDDDIAEDDHELYQREDDDDILHPDEDVEHDESDEDQFEIGHGESRFSSSDYSD